MKKKKKYIRYYIKESKGYGIVEAKSKDEAQDMFDTGDFYEKELESDTQFEGNVAVYNGEENR